MKIQYLVSDRILERIKNSRNYDSFVIELDGTICYVTKWDQYASLRSLYTVPWKRKSKGAKRIIRIAKKWALKNGYTLSLFAGPFADQPLSIQSLEDFYFRMGFTRPEYSGGTMYFPTKNRGE